jgi:hypothetical protein
MARLTRRDWLKLSTFATVGYSASGWMQTLAAETAKDPKRKRSCILLWMPGGPPQTDTFDLKPGHKNGGEFKPIDTSVPGIQISEHLPKLAKQMEHLAIVRSMSTKEGDHQRATYLMRTGYLPQGPIHYPTLGSLVSRELGDSDLKLPGFISVAPNRFLSPAAYSSGFLGPKYAPLIVGEGARVREGQDVATTLRVRNLDLPEGVEETQADTRLDLLKHLEDDFVSSRPGVTGRSHQQAYLQAVRMMKSGASNAFFVETESEELRERYGMNQFGQGCLLARRLVEQGVPFIEVSLSNAPGADGAGLGWDTHQGNFARVKALSAALDSGWSTLMEDLKDRGLLESTTIVWMGEFGRTPNINNNQGRDHFPAAWSAVLGGGGVKGGQVYGSSTEDGMKVKDDPVSTPDLIATVCKSLGIDPLKQNMSNVGRPIRIADFEAQAIDKLVG